MRYGKTGRLRSSHVAEPNFAAWIFLDDEFNIANNLARCSIYEFEDTNSRNGVFVNNQKITKQPLSTGDLIVIGSTRLLVNLG